MRLLRKSGILLVLSLISCLAAACQSPSGKKLEKAIGVSNADIEQSAGATVESESHQAGDKVTTYSKTPAKTMVLPRTQHYAFAHRMLPALFFAEPARFIAILEKSGKNFLHFLWNRLGNRLEASKLVAAEGLDYQIKKLENNTTIALITLPPPQAMTEAYFVAPVFRPQGNRFITLEYSFNFIEGGLRTVLGEWTTTSHLNMGDGPEPTLEAFFEKVVNLIK
jgi:hypothetical protein